MSSQVPTPLVFTAAQAQNCPSFVHPPLDGSMFINEMIDWHMQHSKDHLFAKLIAEGDESDLQVTYAQLGRAVHKLGQTFVDAIPGGPADENGKPRIIAILSSLDPFTYCVLILALLRAGFQPFPLSPRNSQPALVHLLTTTSCSFVVGSVPISDHHATQLERTTRSVLAELEKSGTPLHLLELPHPTDVLSTIMSNEPVKLLPSLGSIPSFSNATEDSPFLILHSSGSTKFPKPIYINQRGGHEWFNVFWLGETDIAGKTIGVMAAPAFHAMGFCTELGAPLACGVIAAFFYPTDPPKVPNSANYLNALIRSKSNVTVAFPTFIEEWAQDPEAINELVGLNIILNYAGGPLSQAAGDKIVAAGVNLQTLYGATETSLLFRPLLKDNMGKDWQYGLFPLNIKPILIPDGNGNVGLNLQECASHHPSLLDDHVKRTYDTHDLLQEHPTRKGYYKIVGRSDDQIIMANGEKTNPGPLENIISGNPIIQGAVMFGRSRNQVGVIIEPAYPIDIGSDREIEKFRNTIWPSVEKANEFAPSHSRIFKEYILIADPVEKPFLRTPKGSVVRSTTLRNYEAEIDAIYRSVEEAITSEWAQPPSTWDEQGLRAFVARIIEGTVGAGGKEKGFEIDREDDLFVQGCDSLQATHIRNALINGLRQAPGTVGPQAIRSITHNFVFEHPTQKSIEDFIVNSVLRNGNSSSGSSEDHIQPMVEMISKYTTDFPVHTPVTDFKPEVTGDVVLLTGSTGTLGSYLLAHLIRDSRVSRVYALNRAATGKSILDRQTEAFVDRGLDVALLQSPKLRLITGDAAREHLGVDETTYLEIRNSVTGIVHNAWRLDFNLKLSSFDPLVRGVRHLADLALHSPRPSLPHVVFTSSVASVTSWAGPGSVPEEPIADPRIAVGNGYGESKWVSEQVLLEASRQRGLPVSNIRIGQLSGSRVNGAWNVTDWVPHIVEAGLALSTLPDFPRHSIVTWLPVDIAADTVFDILFSNSKSLANEFHIVHPRPKSWSDVMSAVAEVLNAKFGSESVRLVPYGEWFSSLEAHLNDEQALERFPALRLLSFLRAGTVPTASSPDRESMGLALLQTRKTQAVSPTLDSVSSLDESDVSKWLAYWEDQGLFKA